MANYAVVHRPRRYAVTRAASGGRTVARFGVAGPAGAGVTGILADLLALGYPPVDGLTYYPTVTDEVWAWVEVGTSPPPPPPPPGDVNYLTPIHPLMVR